MLYELTQLDNRVHGANTSQNARQLILPDVRQPLRDSILDHFVHTEETSKWCRKRILQLKYDLKKTQTIDILNQVQIRIFSLDNQPMRWLCWYESVPFYPCLQQSLFSFNSEQFNWARPIRIPANVPCETKNRTEV